MTKICIIAGNADEAYRYARSQYWEKDQWFFPNNPNELMFKTNFHVLVIGSAGFNFPPSMFEKIFKLAHERGKIDRR